MSNYKRLSQRREDGTVYTLIPLNNSELAEVGVCYTGTIANTLTLYEDLGTPDELARLKEIEQRKETYVCTECKNLFDIYSEIGLAEICPFCGAGDLFHLTKEMLEGVMRHVRA
jgi:DNA-directed RNA polymerase subunit RPC12/RpoP